MTSFSLSIQGYQSATGDLQIDAPPPPKYIGWRVRHASEGGRVTPNGMPCVNPSINVASVPFTESMQWMSYWINSGNINLTKSKWRVVYKYNTAFTNGNGFDIPGDPRADYVNGQDIHETLPKLMRGIICSGNFFYAEQIGNEIVITPGVGAVDGNKTIPPPEVVLAKHQYFTATTAKRGLDGLWHVNNFPQGGGGPVLVPYILREPARFPIAWFEHWEADTLPDPLKVYKL